MTRCLSPLLVATFLAIVPACLPSRVAAASNAHDEPVPAQEARAELQLELDLPRTGSCEEDFDLALYANRGVEFIRWAAGSQKCSGRRLTIRYLPARIDGERLTKRVKELAQQVRVLTHD